ncbi:MAG: 1,3-beta-galactosyl-N-acetylhexosamine phosphorylase [Eubacteriales bacterium]|nr:1,3-beta-galactosyl-N-acetylhexosamine phosphorylase [Eubacteriales bacterium]MDD3882864.1 1,3-beta-galactosyl-N-acetylhexosamine phosphorylase [Eubacteriales bacterium]MDD4512100.1 1,3-beta-galactosyl-N-acetylhexosamine phosphorylase [Eubacteriales bacterium]
MSGKGGFTLPGEAGQEKLTLELCKKWGADCIRDSDGTQLSDEILKSGVPIYSTICLVRSVNEWAKRNMDKLQRNFLITAPELATGESLEIQPLKGFFDGQFTLCPEDEPKEYWQVFDRTESSEIPKENWEYDAESKTVLIRNTVFGHMYTVSFLATRIWEEISMYNHITNDWGDREHLMAVEPRYPEAQEALLSFLKKWLDEHPATSVVRFTSLFYNFCWIWGSEKRRRTIFSDWGSYDFTANPVSLREFEQEYGYKMTAEDFVNGGLYRPTHTPPCQKQLDWMEFTGRFVREFGKKCVDLVHSYGKKAYVFYDDSWIGIEPWSGHFGEFGFDGLIKCVFNAFEARLCAGVKEVPVHELRLHPYLFPTGLTGEPTFAEGGHPERDAKRYWTCVRRALMRVKVDRIGLGGYLHLVEPFKEFQDEIEKTADEFRMLKSLHEAGAPWETGIRIGVLHSWGKKRTWNCSGHMHEHPELYLNHLYESLAGMPFSLSALSLSDVAESGVPDDIDVIINTGRAGDAWSGGDMWQSPKLQSAINAFVVRGGALLGVGEPSAVTSGANRFALSGILGVDEERGQGICLEKYDFEKTDGHFITKGMKEAPAFGNAVAGVYALDGKTKVLFSNGRDVSLSAREFGNGRSVYLCGYTHSSENARLLYMALLWLAKKDGSLPLYLPDDCAVECAYFPVAKSLVAINNSGEHKRASIQTESGGLTVEIAPYGISVTDC